MKTLLTFSLRKSQVLHSECENEHIVLPVVIFTYRETKDVTSLSYYERCEWSVQRPVL